MQKGLYGKVLRARSSGIAAAVVAVFSCMHNTGMWGLQRKIKDAYVPNLEP